MLNIIGYISTVITIIYIVKEYIKYRKSLPPVGLVFIDTRVEKPYIERFLRTFFHVRRIWRFARYYFKKEIQNITGYLKSIWRI